jgi:hypothetical protein
MDISSLPKTHVLTRDEEEFVKKLSPKEKELHFLAIQLLETSYRPEWSHMYKEKVTKK